MAITVLHNGTDLGPKRLSQVREWLKMIIRSEKKNPGTITYVFTTDDVLFEYNRKFLSHATLTDILTFDYCKGDQVSGDIMISVERVTENAGKYGVTFDQELRRVMVHGLLHLCGYKDKTANEKRMMRKREDEALKKFDRINPPDKIRRLSKTKPKRSK